MPWKYLTSSEKVVTLGHTYFRVLCCCLSMFLASVLVRVLHACVALALWKLLVGCGCFWLLRAHGFWMYLRFGAVAKLWETSDKQFGIAFPLFAATWMKVESISQAPCSRTCLWELQPEKASRDYSICLSHPRIAAMFYVECPVATWIFGYRSGYRATAKKQKVHYRMKKKALLAVYGWLHMTTG